MRTSISSPRSRDNDRVELFVEYNDTEYDEFTYETAYSDLRRAVFNPASTGCPFSAPFPGPSFGTLLTTIDCSGQRVAARTAMGRSGLVRAHVPLRQRLEPERTRERPVHRCPLAQLRVRRARERVDSNQVYNLDLTYVSPQGNWTVSAFVHNIDDEAVYTGGGEQGFAPPLVYATIGAPRTYGARLQYSFD